MYRIVSFILSTALLLSACSSKDQAGDGKNKNDDTKSDVVAIDLADLQANKEKKQLEYQMSGIPFTLDGEKLHLAGVTITPASEWAFHGATGEYNALYTYGPLGDDTDSATLKVKMYATSDTQAFAGYFEPWLKQMSLPDGRPAENGNLQYTLDVDGMKVHMMTVYGFYDEPDPDNASKKIVKSHYRLVGSVVEGPQGHVVLKLTGPDYTARIMIEAYMAMIKSITKG